MSRWHPTASVATLREFASLLGGIRKHFETTECLEVFTPVLSAAAVSDRHIQSFATTLANTEQTLFLHTSPEYPMKRLLAAGIGDCYQICRVFRQGEQGRRHNPEFTLLEWYRVGWDHQALMREVDVLMRKLWPGASLPETEELTYRDALFAACALDLQGLRVDDIKRYLQERNIDLPASLPDDLDSWLDLLFSLVVTHTFPSDRFTLLTDYPPSQAALARIRMDDRGQQVAARFELYWGALELANGYHELQDADEQRSRFEQDLERRRSAGAPCYPLDENLLAALSAGLPDCAGVALGLERLLMVLTGLDHIEDTMSFPIEYA